MKRDDDDGSVNDDGSGDIFKLSPGAPMQVMMVTMVIFSNCHRRRC